MQYLLLILVSTLAIIDALSEDEITSSEHEIDLVIEMLLNNESSEYNGSANIKYSEENTTDQEKTPESVFSGIISGRSDGVWKCGKCDNLNESKLIYMETYDVDNNDAKYYDLQVGLSLNHMRCVTVTCENQDFGTVDVLYGNCGSEGVTIRLTAAAVCDVNVYS